MQWATDIGDRVVVVEAVTLEEARRLTGLTLENFREATDDDLERWSDVCEQPLDAREIDTVCKLIGRELKSVGNRRVNDHARGRRIPQANDMNVWRAVWLLITLGKLELLAADLDESNSVS